MIASPSISDFIGRGPGARTGSLENRLTPALRAIRTHLDMEVAFVSEFADQRRYFRQVDSSRPDIPVNVGGSDPLEESYCQRVVDGRLPELMTNACDVPAARELPVTAALPVGAHISVPIRLRDGHVYGTFCCFSCAPNQSLNGRDLAMMRVFAGLIADQIDEELESNRSRTEKSGRVNRVLATGDFSIVYQRIVRLDDRGTAGVEALARFAGPPDRAPNAWFDEAAEVGLGIPLENLAIRRALQVIPRLDAGAYVGVNVSPEVITGGGIEAVLEGQPLERIVLEVTEHAAVSHYGELTAAMQPLRRLGLRIAVDDAGAGYASFRHILSLAPDIIKLDMSITRDIDRDRSRRALAAAMISFAHATGSRIVAEGVETAAELETLRELGIDCAQGFFLDRPSAM